jgi:hypothetical protein
VTNPATQQNVPATNVQVVSSTQIHATSPGVTTLANYYITVTTSPGGQTSAVMPSAECTTAPYVDCFVYSTAAPVVTGVSPISGYTTHSTAISITGTGFINGATVTMVQDNNGTPNYANQGQATAVQVVSNSQITALTYPFTTVGQAFFVMVTTPGGGASQLPNTAVYTFTTAPP